MGNGEEEIGKEGYPDGQPSRREHNGESIVHEHCGDNSFDGRGACLPRMVTEMLVEKEEHSPGARLLTWSTIQRFLFNHPDETKSQYGMSRHDPRGHHELRGGTSRFGAR